MSIRGDFYRTALLCSLTCALLLTPVFIVAPNVQAQADAASGFGQPTEDSGLRFGPTTQTVPPPPVYQPPTAPVFPRQVPAEGNDELEPEEDVTPEPSVISPSPERHRAPRIAPTRPASPARAGRPAPPVAEVVRLDGPLDRLRQAQGNQSLAARLNMIRPSGYKQVRQEPEIAWSDGNTPVQLAFLAYSGGDAPNLALTNLRLRRLFRANDGRWMLDAQAHENAWEARVFVMEQGKTLSVPVVVAPRVAIDFNQDGRIDEADYALLLDALKNADPAFDLNGDGATDYIDEYIFLANYLLQSGALQSLQMSTN